MTGNGNRLTLERLRQLRRPEYVDTLYGAQVGIVRLSAGFVLRMREQVGDDGQPRDPIAANRSILRESLVEPEPTDEVLEALESDVRAYADLIQRILVHNGLTAEDRRTSARDFRGGGSGPEALPEGES